MESDIGSAKLLFNLSMAFAHAASDCEKSDSSAKGGSYRHTLEWIDGLFGYISRVRPGDPSSVLATMTHLPGQLEPVLVPVLQTSMVLQSHGDACIAPSRLHGIDDALQRWPADLTRPLTAIEDADALDT